ncbi:MAG: globin [Chromatiales bacterium]|jgi:hemoglobin-like flavoprotein
METESRIPADALKRFQSSLARVSAQDLFFEQFYERLFLESKEIDSFFHDRELASIIDKLRMTLMMVAEAAEGRPGLEMYLEMLGGIHRRLQVEPRFFRHWRVALLATVARYDPQYDALIESAWQRVIDHVIACMRQHESAGPEPSSH